MTLIVTHIEKLGIIHASDSNLTSSDDKLAGEGKKVFHIPKLNAGISIAGSYGVGNETMDIWLPKFIDGQCNSTNIDLKTFSHNLKDTLQATMTTQQKKSGSIIHISGYVEESGLSHPEFWFIRNVHKIDETTGGYKDIDETFEITEDFWSRDGASADFKKAWTNPIMNPSQTYFNGFDPGRIGYNAVSSELRKFFNHMWSVPGWKFRPPKSIEETETLIKNQLQIIDTLFLLSEYNARYIGGTTQTLVLKPTTKLAGQN